MTQKHSVLIITDRLHFIGGAETYVKEFASIFKEYGNKVDCLTYFQDFKIEDDSNINMLSFGHKSFNILNINFSRIFSFIKKLSELTKTKKYQYIFLHLYIAPFLLFLFNFFPNSKKYIVVHGIRCLEIKSSIAPPKKYKILGKIKRLIRFGPEMFYYKFIQKYALRKANGVVTLSEYAKSQLKENFNIEDNKIHVIPGAIDHHLYKSVSFNQKRLLKEKLGFSKDSNLLVLISRIEPRKNVLAAIKAMKIIVKHLKNTTLLIVSPSQDAYNQSYLAACYVEVSNNKLGEHIIFTTGIDSKKTIQYYQCADVALTISSDLETFGYTLIEALACGTPVVGTNVGNIPFILSKIDKRLIAKSNYKDIAKKVIELLRLPKEEKVELIKKCSSEIKKNNNYKLFMKKYYKLLDEK